METTCSLHPSLESPRSHRLSLELPNSHCSSLEPPNCLCPILEQPSSVSPRPNLNFPSSLSSLNLTVASDHLGLHHASKPGADELPSSQPGAVDLPPSQTRVTELSPSQHGAVDFPPSDPGTNEIPQSSVSASDHLKLHHDPEPRATSSPSLPELLSFLRQILEQPISLFAT